MRTERELRKELWKVRKRLAERRSRGELDEHLYAAQQTLLWALNHGRSPTELDDLFLLLEERWRSGESRQHFIRENP